MDLKLKGHVALVQGASQGIGRGIASVLSKEGCDLLLTARNPESLKQTASEITSNTGRKVLWEVNSSEDIDSIPHVIQKIQNEWRRLDIVVCNSGGPPAGNLLDLSAEQWLDAAKLLLVSPAEMVKQSLPLLSQSPAPRFFVITSGSSKQPIPGLLLSNVYRPGLIGLIKSLSDELATQKVCCHSIAPGLFDTGRLQHLFEIQSQKTGKSPETIRAEKETLIPAGRLGEPEEIGNLVAFLSSPLASYLNGKNWVIDGGLIRGL